MLAGLLKRTVGTCNNEDSTVHLSCTGNHVLDIVSMAGAVNVSVVTLSGLVLNVTGVDGDSSLSLLGCVIDLVVSEELDLIVAECEDLGDSCGKSGLTVVNVADSTNVDMGFSTFKGFLCHDNSLLNIYYWLLLDRLDTSVS